MKKHMYVEEDGKKRVEVLTLSSSNDVTIIDPATGEVLTRTADGWINSPIPDKNLDEISDGTNYGRVLNSQLTDGKVNQLDDGINNVTVIQVRSHIDNADIHREINDLGSATTDLWSADKIQSEIDSSTSSLDEIPDGTTYGRIRNTELNNGKVTRLDDGTNSASVSEVRTHLDNLTKHREINDEGSSTTDLWSASRISEAISTVVLGLDPQNSIISQLNFTIEEPVSPSIGDRYINTSTGNSSETGTPVVVNNIYEWGGTGWYEIVANEGMYLWDESLNKAYVFNGTNWVLFSSTVSHNYLAGIQGGTTDEFFHLTNAEHSGLTGGNNTSLHKHDDRYYTESEADSLLAGKSDTGHNHDDRYFTETELSDATSAGTSGASKIGAFDEFDNSDNETVQSVLKDFDTILNSTIKTRTILTDTDDCDNLTDGVYAWSNPPPANAPSTFGILWQVTDADQKCQIFFGSSGSGRVYVRRADSGTFYDWADFLTSVFNTDVDVNSKALNNVGVLSSNVASGTSPFSIASTTLVTNLNVEYLGGLTANDFYLDTNTVITSSYIGVNQNGTGDRVAYITLYSDDINPFGAKISRNAGENGAFFINHYGTGDIIIYRSSGAIFRFTTTELNLYLPLDMQGNSIYGVNEVVVEDTIPDIYLMESDTTDTNWRMVVSDGNYMLQLVSDAKVWLSTKFKAFPDGHVWVDWYTESDYFISTIATGTAPVQVTSTTLCTNLNADMLDGYHASDVLLKTYTYTSNTYITVNDADFVVRDTTDTISNYICRDWSASKLYLGTADAVVTFRSNIDCNSNPLNNVGVLSSNVASGTSPFSIASTTLVNNLNVEYLGGLTSSDFYLKTQTSINDASVVINDTGIGDRDAYVDFQAADDGTYARNARIIRLNGKNNTFDFYQYGTGDIRFYNETSGFVFTIKSSSIDCALPLNVTGNTEVDGNITTKAVTAGTWRKVGHSTVSFYHDNDTICGLYDHTNSNWMVKSTKGSLTQLYYNGAVRLNTSSDGVTVNGDVDITVAADVSCYNNVWAGYSWSTGYYAGSTAIGCFNTNGSNQVSFLAQSSASSALYLARAMVAQASKFYFKADGSGGCAGSWTPGGADVAEYYEWVDGNPNNEDRTGYSVVIENGKIRKAIGTDDPFFVFGIISATATLVMNAAELHWEGKYKKNELGKYLKKEVKIFKFDREIAEIDDDGAETVRTEKVEIREDIIPDGIVVPEDAEIVIVDENDISEEYDPNLEYIPRSQRPEWAMVGFSGRIRLRSGQPTGDRWIKVQDINESVEEWLVRG